MPGFQFQKLKLKDAYLIRPFYAADQRGNFAKLFERDIFREAGVEFHLNETFVSRSEKNIIRGLHFQLHNPQAKLVTVVAGSAWDVIVDLRLDSPSFAQWSAEKLTAENHLGFYVPRGFAHGFASLDNGTVMLYQCDGKYDPKTDTGIRYDDPALNIPWPVDSGMAIHSQRDLKLGSLKEFISGNICKSLGGG